jgi:hypothetical protein
MLARGRQLLDNIPGQDVVGLKLYICGDPGVGKSSFASVLARTETHTTHILPDIETESWWKLAAAAIDSDLKKKKLKPNTAPTTAQTTPPSKFGASSMQQSSTGEHVNLGVTITDVTPRPGLRYRIFDVARPIDLHYHQSLFLHTAVAIFVIIIDLTDTAHALTSLMRWYRYISKFYIPPEVPQFVLVGSHLNFKTTMEASDYKPELIRMYQRLTNEGVLYTQSPLLTDCRLYSHPAVYAWCTRLSVYRAEILKRDMNTFQGGSRARFVSNVLMVLKQLRTASLYMPFMPWQEFAEALARADVGNDVCKLEEGGLKCQCKKLDAKPCAYSVTIDLHRTDEVQFFCDQNSPLRNHVFLDATWVHNSYLVPFLYLLEPDFVPLTHWQKYLKDTIAKPVGSIDSLLLSHLPTIPGVRTISILEHFDLCVKLANGQYIFPWHLETQMPANRWVPTHTHHFGLDLETRVIGTYDPVDAFPKLQLQLLRQGGLPEGHTLSVEAYKGAILLTGEHIQILITTTTIDRRRTVVIRTQYTKDSNVAMLEVVLDICKKIDRIYTSNQIYFLYKLALFSSSFAVRYMSPKALGSCLLTEASPKRDITPTSATSASTSTPAPDGPCVTTTPTLTYSFMDVRAARMLSEKYVFGEELTLDVIGLPFASENVLYINANAG